MSAWFGKALEMCSEESTEARSGLQRAWREALVGCGQREAEGAKGGGDKIEKVYTPSCVYTLKLCICA